MIIRLIFIIILFLPAVSAAEALKSNILFYVPTIIAATSNPANIFSVGTAHSTDISYINFNHKFNSWLILSNSEQQQIMLKVKEKLGQFDDPALWALAIRTQPNPIGTILAQNVEIKLFSNYNPDTLQCCILPFSAFDHADVTYIGITGFINFESNYSGTFEIGFKKEKVNDVYILSNKIVTVKGCWNIAGEEGISGCDL